MKRTVLVDTSVWIDFLNGNNTPERFALRELIASDAKICLCPIILQEVLQGIRKDLDYDKAKNSLLGFQMLKLDPVEAAIKAADLYRNLRKKGLTIRKSNDCLIALHAMLYRMPLLHNDTDFGRIASGSSLKIFEIV